MVDLFREVRERVSAQEAARRYGLTFDRRGWALCPFHKDTHPSMSFQHGRFRCWACGESGDAVDFTARLFGLDAMGAVERLDADFSLSLPLHRKPTKAEAEQARRRMEVAQAHREFEEWRSGFILALNAAYRAGELLIKRRPDKLKESDLVALRMHESFGIWSDALSYGTPEEQAQIFRERGKIGEWIGKVFSD